MLGFQSQQEMILFIQQGRSVFSFIPSFTHFLPESFSNDNSIGVTWNNANADFKYGTIWGYSISESVGFYGEFGSIPIDSGSNSHGFDWGFTWAVKNNIQLDIFAGKSLNDPATDFLSIWVFNEIAPIIYLIYCENKGPTNNSHSGNIRSPTTISTSVAIIL